MRSCYDKPDTSLVTAFERSLDDFLGFQFRTDIVGVGGLGQCGGCGGEAIFALSASAHASWKHLFGRVSCEGIISC